LSPAGTTLRATRRRPSRIDRADRRRQGGIRSGSAWSPGRDGDREPRAGCGLSDNAFGVYLIHPPVLIGAAILLHTLAWNAIAKALLLTALAAVGSFAASAFVLRKSPLRAIV